MLRIGLMGSPALRAVIKYLTITASLTTLKYDTKGETKAKWQPGDSTIFVNPDNGGGFLWQGGSRGASRAGKSTGFMALAHELWHAYDATPGGPRSGDPNFNQIELRAVDFENRVRAELGLLSRDCIYSCGKTLGELHNVGHRSIPDPPDWKQ